MCSTTAVLNCCKQSATLGSCWWQTSSVVLTTQCRTGGRPASFCSAKFMFLSVSVLSTRPLCGVLLFDVLPYARWQQLWLVNDAVNSCLAEWVNRRIDWRDCHQVVKEEVAPPANKYTVRAPKDLRSKYELKMEERRMKQLADEEERLRQAEAERLRVRRVLVILLRSDCFSFSSELF